MNPILVGIFHTIQNAVVVGVTVQRIGICTGIVLCIATGLHVVGSAVSIAVGVRVVGVRIVDVFHTVVVVVVVNAVDGAVAIEVAQSYRVIGHTGVCIVGVELRIDGTEVGEVAVTVFIGSDTGGGIRIRIAGVQWVRITCRVISSVKPGFLVIGISVVVAVRVGVVGVFIVCICNAVVVVVKIVLVHHPIAVKVAGSGGKVWHARIGVVRIISRIGRRVVGEVAVTIRIRWQTLSEIGIGVAFIGRVGFTGVHGAVVVGILCSVGNTVFVAVGTQRVGFAGVHGAVVVGIFRSVGNAIVVGIAVKGVGIGAGIVLPVTAGFHIVGNSVAVTVGVRIVVLNVTQVVHPVVVIVQVVLVHDAIAVVITGWRRDRRHTGIVVVGVIEGVTNREVSIVAVVVVVHTAAKDSG